MEVGVDEAGRGSLAGPVVVGAVVWPPALRGPEDDPRLTWIQDSKLLSAAQRARAAEVVRELALAWAVVEVPAQRVDALNILRATMHGMHEALDDLARRGHTFDAVLVDGDRFPPYLPPPGTPLHARAREQDVAFVPSACVVDGDRVHLAIAAASVLAKTHRDARMAGPVHAAHPAYGFARHKGYGAPAHLEALRVHGPCPEHRRSFAPVRRLCEPEA